MIKGIIVIKIRDMYNTASPSWSHLARYFIDLYYYDAKI